VIVCRHCRCYFPAPQNRNDPARIYCPNCGKALLEEKVVEGKRIDLGHQTHCIGCGKKISIHDLVRAQRNGHSLGLCERCCSHLKVIPIPMTL